MFLFYVKFQNIDYALSKEKENQILRNRLFSSLFFPMMRNIFLTDTWHKPANEMKSLQSVMTSQPPCNYWGIPQSQPQHSNLATLLKASPRALPWALCLHDPIRVCQSSPGHQSSPPLSGWERSSLLFSQVTSLVQTYLDSSLCLEQSRGWIGC